MHYQTHTPGCWGWYVDRNRMQNLYSKTHIEHFLLKNILKILSIILQKECTGKNLPREGQENLYSLLIRNNKKGGGGKCSGGKDLGK